MSQFCAENNSAYAMSRKSTGVCKRHCEGCMLVELGGIHNLPSSEWCSLLHINLDLAGGYQKGFILGHLGLTVFNTVIAKSKNFWCIGRKKISNFWKISSLVSYCSEWDPFWTLYLPLVLHAVSTGSTRHDTSCLAQGLQHVSSGLETTRSVKFQVLGPLTRLS